MLRKLKCTLPTVWYKTKQIYIKLTEYKDEKGKEKQEMNKTGKIVLKRIQGKGGKETEG